jgi:Chain length determinant protein
MDLFSIGGTLWRHKWVSIPLVLLTMLGMLYVLELRAPTYQAKADILLTNPPASPTAFQIAQNPRLAKMNNPLANLGSLTYVADVLIDSVTAPTAKQELAQAGASGYQVVLDSASQSNVPPAIDVAGTGLSAQAATRSAQLVATAISSDLLRLQASQHVQNKYMITSVEYVRPSPATKSSENLETAVGVAAIGLIVLLVAVSIAQGREEQKNRRSRHERRSGYREGKRRDLTDSEAELPDGEFRRPHSGPQPAMRMGESYAAGSARRPGMQPNGDDPWGQSG